MAQLETEHWDLVIEASELGVGCIDEGDHWPFLLLIGAKGKRDLIDLHTVSGTIDAALLDQGREIVKGMPIKLYAIVYDAFVNFTDGKHDAICVETGRRGEPTAYVFAQRYAKQKRGIEKIGEPVFMAETQQLLTAKSKPRRKKN